MEKHGYLHDPISGILNAGRMVGEYVCSIGGFIYPSAHLNARLYDLSRLAFRFFDLHSCIFTQNKFPTCH